MISAECSKVSSEVNINVLSIHTNEDFQLFGIDTKMTILTLKVNLELMSGIPTNLQRISYLDQGDLEDSSTLKHHDVVEGAYLKMRVWDEWKALVEASSKGYIGDVFRQGVTFDCDFSNANTRQMSEERRKEWIQSRAFVAVLVAAHSGHKALVQSLMDKGANFLGKTAHGRNILHITAASGQSKCIEMLLKNGMASLIDQKDCDDQIPIDCAIDQSSASKILYMFRWNLRTSGAAKKIKKLTRDELMAHQIHDSSMSTAMKGKYKQHYQSKILPVQEYRGTEISSKKSDYYTKTKKIF